jgi:outer membrane biosynthesis protein TonB
MVATSGYTAPQPEVRERSVLRPHWIPCLFNQYPQERVMTACSAGLPTSIHPVSLCLIDLSEVRININHLGWLHIPLISILERQSRWISELEVSPVYRVNSRTQPGLHRETLSKKEKKKKLTTKKENKKEKPKTKQNSKSPQNKKPKEPDKQTSKTKNKQKTNQTNKQTNKKKPHKKTKQNQNIYFSKARDTLFYYFCTRKLFKVEVITQEVL